MKQIAFYLMNDHDIFTTTEVYLVVSKEIAEDCKITDSGIIRWQKQSSVRIDGSVLTDDALSVRVGMHEYSLDETEDSISDFEAETGIDAEELLTTISEIRSEYLSVLQELSEAEYQKVCNKMFKAIIGLVVMWGSYNFIRCSYCVFNCGYKRGYFEWRKNCEQRENGHCLHGHCCNVVRRLCRNGECCFNRKRDIDR